MRISGPWDFTVWTSKATSSGRKDLGDMSTRNSFGEGSSPVIHGNTMVVNWDH